MLLLIFIALRLSVLKHQRASSATPPVTLDCTHPTSPQHPSHASHIDDMLMACESINTLKDFKSEFLTRFEGTDEGEVTTYLGCELIRDRANQSINFRQAVYPRKILQLYGEWEKPAVKTPMEAGVRLSTVDSPEVADPATLTIQCKFVQCPGAVHLKAAERVLQFLCCSSRDEDGLTYSDPGPELLNRLLCWVDSDYASDPDTRKSVTGYVLSLNNAPISWKAKQQDCVTLSSA
eukprot:763673-Rhodomonas_salina.2